MVRIDLVHGPRGGIGDWGGVEGGKADDGHEDAKSESEHG